MASADRQVRVRSAPDGATSHQLDAVAGLVVEVLRDRLRGVFLHGSAVTGGLKPASDLDFFVVASRPTTEKQQADLIDQLRPISARTLRPGSWRPVELTIVAQSARPDLVHAGHGRVREQVRRRRLGRPPPDN